MAIESRNGRCLCGAVELTASQIEPHIHACHCSMCRRWSGGPALAVTVGSLEIRGEENVSVYDSSPWAERAFCKLCGTNLFYRIKETGMTVLWSGTLDSADGLELAGEIYVDEKPGFYDLAGDHPRQTGEEFLKSVGLSPE
ncbi:MAG: GFA family protein [Myxococcota bacterium]|nr:GFA family protein [Myxococcota bacterium]